MVLGVCRHLTSHATIWRCAARHGCIMCYCTRCSHCDAWKWTRTLNAIGIDQIHGVQQQQQIEQMQRRTHWQYQMLQTWNTARGY